MDTTPSYGHPSKGSNIALFNEIGLAGVVRNLNLHATFSGTTFIAGVAAQNYGTIENVTVEGTIAATGYYTGGIAGLSGCTFDGDDVIPGKILRCLNNAAVTGTQYVGGDEYMTNMAE